jgi:hypothetical protein
MLRVGVLLERLSVRRGEDGRQEPAFFEPEVRKRKKARMASPHGELAADSASAGVPISRS